jgi:hypothetical protein
MKVINLTSWAGLHFSYIPGQEIEVDDHVGEARIAAGHAKAVETPPDNPPAVQSPVIPPKQPPAKTGRPVKRSKTNAS